MVERVQPMGKRHARSAAILHRAGIPTGFLSSLGEGFLRQIYAAMPAAPAGFGYVWEEIDGRVLGFVACAESTGQLYKQALLRRGVPMAAALLPRCLRPSILRRLWETLRYPSEVGESLPAAELLSIAVSEEARGQGVGTALVAAAFDEFRRRNIARVKVAVGADNEAANRFYRRCGFRLVRSRMHHGRPMNLYVRKEGA